MLKKGDKVVLTKLVVKQSNPNVKIDREDPTTFIVLGEKDDIRVIHHAVSDQCILAYPEGQAGFKEVYIMDEFEPLSEDVSPEVA